MGEETDGLACTQAARDTTNQKPSGSLAGIPSSKDAKCLPIWLEEMTGCSGVAGGDRTAASSLEPIACGAMLGVVASHLSGLEGREGPHTLRRVSRATTSAFVPAGMTGIILLVATRSA